MPGRVADAFDLSEPRLGCEGKREALQNGRRRGGRRRGRGGEGQGLCTLRATGIQGKAAGSSGTPHRESGPTPWARLGLRPRVLTGHLATPSEPQALAARSG